jgi:SAM-dependent methyltransferase
MGVGLDHLQGLYAETADPWGFEHSAYEQGKFAATRAALSQSGYHSAFELGCGNGQLARHLVDICERYTGMDAVATALRAARQTVPQGRFVQGFYPGPLPEGNFDLLILSEVLYFLDHGGLEQLAEDIVARWPKAEIICVTWLGPTGNPLQGEDAFECFARALKTHDFACVTQTKDYRIDRALPRATR